MFDKLRKVLELLNGFFQLRHCTKVGSLTRVVGRVMVNNDGQMIIGNNVIFRGSHLPIELGTFKEGKLTIGSRTSINSGVSICAQQSVTIGNNCGIGNYSLIIDTDFHKAGDFNAPAVARPIVIEDGVWIGAHVVILKGVTIGEGAVVSAGSVVATSVAPHTMVGGNPARFIKKLEQALEPEIEST